jgi:hypothetical protein
VGDEAAAAALGEEARSKYSAEKKLLRGTKEARESARAEQVLILLASLGALVQKYKY